MINRVYIPATLSLNIDGNVYLKGDKELMQSYFKELMKQDPSIDVEVCITRIDSKKTNTGVTNVEVDKIRSVKILS